ncbi:MAG: hypothetical protein R3A79_22385, partial [Nannocystaceae bacterium]
ALTEALPTVAELDSEALLRPSSSPPHPNAAIAASVSRRRDHPPTFPTVHVIVIAPFSWETRRSGSAELQLDATATAARRR